MGQITTLIDIVHSLSSLNEEATIYAAEPWTASSKVLVECEPAEGGLPSEAEKQGLKYFLEIFIARDFLEDWASSLGRNPSDLEKCERLIQYAVNDA